MVLTRQVLRDLNPWGPAAWCPCKTSWEPTPVGARGTPSHRDWPITRQRCCPTAGQTRRAIREPGAQPQAWHPPEVCGIRCVPPVNSGPILCNLRTMSQIPILLTLLKLALCSLHQPFKFSTYKKQRTRPEQDKAIKILHSYPGREFSARTIERNQSFRPST